MGSGEDLDFDSSAVYHISETAPPRPGFLPDLDDSSMNSIFQYVEFVEQDLYWSFLSDSLFMLGGILYILMSAWDFTTLNTTMIVKRLLDVCGPLVYVINSLVDIQWAQEARKRVKAKKQIIRELDSWNLATESSQSSLHFLEDFGSLSWFHRIRKHAAHRRSLLAALTFGIAAVLAFLAALEITADLTEFCSYISDHTYLISAMVAISGKRTRPWLIGSTLHWTSDPETLEDLGDLFFFIGSAVDCTLTDLDLERPYWSMISSLLWFADACFYFRADVVMSNQKRSAESQEEPTLV